MISIIDKCKCVGCEACINICPKHCILPTVDDEGFVYPSVNTDNCIDCHLCENVCPVLTPFEPHEAISSYAAWIDDDRIRLKSSSGGIFYRLAEWVIKRDGVVYGAAFDRSLKLRHTKGEKLTSLEQFRGSKYLQSRLGNTYKGVKQVLNTGRMVLYSGTGCQISGLKHFLKKDYSNLIALEVMCHGVPSPKVWDSYIKHIVGRGKIEKNKYPFHSGTKETDGKTLDSRLNGKIDLGKAIFFAVILRILI